MTDENNSKYNNLDMIIKEENGIKFAARVIPNASKCELVGVFDKSIKIKLDVLPIDGKANEKCIKFLAKLLGVSKSSVRIITGEKNKNKIIYIRGNPEDLFSKLVEIL